MAKYRYFQLDHWERVDRIPESECGEWLIRNHDSQPKEITHAEYIAYTRGFARGIAKRGI